MLKSCQPPDSATENTEIAENNHPHPAPAEGGAGSVGFGRWMRPRSGMQRRDCTRAYVRLHGRIPKIGAPAPRFGAPPPEGEGNFLAIRGSKEAPSPLGGRLG